MSYFIFQITIKYLLCKNLILCAYPYNRNYIQFLKIKKAHPILQSQSFLIPVISYREEKYTQLSIIYKQK